MAPNMESIRDPIKPATPPTMISGHCGGLFNKVPESTVYNAII